MEVHCDGSCLGNPGPGGIGIVIVNDEEVIKLSSSFTHTTNNCMELTAAISAISYIRSVLNYTGNINLFTDSNYVCAGMKTWMPNWKKNNWKTKGNKPVKNIELWKMLDDVSENCTFTHEYGHSGNHYNEIADKLAKEAAKGN